MLEVERTVSEGGRWAILALNASLLPFDSFIYKFGFSLIFQFHSSKHSQAVMERGTTIA